MYFFKNFYIYMTIIMRKEHLISETYMFQFLLFLKRAIRCYYRIFRTARLLHRFVYFTMYCHLRKRALNARPVSKMSETKSYCLHSTYGCHYFCLNFYLIHER